MGCIFQVIGTPLESDSLDFLQSDESQKYVRSFKKSEKVDLQKIYPGTDPMGIDLLYRMLEFNPNKRISASEAL